MWKANGKTTTSLFLESLFPKTDIYICEMLPLANGRDGSGKKTKKTQEATGCP
jgi:hypothetical protein